MRKEKKLKRVNKANRKLLTLAANNTQQPKKPTHMICNGVRTSDKKEWNKEVYVESNKKFAGNEGDDEEKRRRI